VTRSVLVIIFSYLSSFSSLKQTAAFIEPGPGLNSLGAWCKGFVPVLGEKFKHGPQLGLEKALLKALFKQVGGVFLCCSSLSC